MTDWNRYRPGIVSDLLTENTLKDIQALSRPRYPMRDYRLGIVEGDAQRWINVMGAQWQ